jgi:hypothetical protein
VQRGIDVAVELINGGGCPSVEVWVAAGTYRPSMLTNEADARSATFQLVSKVALYGGFAGTEAVRAERNIAQNVTFLSGQLGNTDVVAPAYHVVLGASGATLDGFTITGGDANGDSPDDAGAGMYNEYSSPTVSNCTFSGNGSSAGGAMYNRVASPLVTNCTFSDNYVTSGNGGAMRNDSASPILTNCTFTRNQAQDSGAAMSNEAGSSPSVTNCLFVGNFANEFGGAMYNHNASPVVTNCTVAGNGAAQTGGGIYNSGSVPTVTNSILWGDTTTGVGEIIDADSSSSTVTFSTIEGGYDAGMYVTTTDPLFVDAANGDFRLSAASPAIDAGNACATFVMLKDLEGNPRWDIASVADVVSGMDIGAFEYQGTPGVDTLVGAFSCP